MATGGADGEQDFGLGGELGWVLRALVVLPQMMLRIRRNGRLETECLQQLLKLNPKAYAEHRLTRLSGG